MAKLGTGGNRNLSPLSNSIEDNHSTRLEIITKQSKKTVKNITTKLLRPARPSKFARRNKQIKAAGTQRLAIAANWNSPTALKAIKLAQISGSGIYRVVLATRGRIRPIERLLGSDNDGILYLGMSTDLRQRITDIIASFLKAKPVHGSRQRYHRFRLQRKLRIELIHLQWCNLDVPDLVKRQFELERDEWDVYEQLDTERKKLIDAGESEKVKDFDQASAFLWERSGLAAYVRFWRTAPAK